MRPIYDWMKRSVREFARDLGATHRMGNQHNLPLLASSVAFFSIFSLCPLLILSFLGSQFFFRRLSSTDLAQNGITTLLNSLLPSLDPSVSQGIVAILNQNALTNFFNIVLLCWSVYELFDCLHTAFINLSVRGNVRTGVWTHVISSLCFLVVMGASTLFLILFTIDPSLLQKLLHRFLAQWDPRAIRWLIDSIAIGSVIASVTFIYKLMPTQKVRLIFALRGAILFVVLFLLGKMGYQIYARFYRFMNAGTYGPFFTFILVIIWIYYLSRTFLFSAQYAVYLEEKSSRM